MRCSVSFLLLILAVSSTASPQNQNIQQNFGTTHFPNNYNYPQYYEENDLQSEQFFFFDMDLLKEISQDQREGNILISPLSIKSVLAMILEGAKNESAEELRVALRLPNNRRVREQFQKLLAEFQRPRGGVNIQMANRIFVSKKLSPLAEYEEILTKYYNSNVTKVDFYNPTLSANVINSWANEKTRGLIPTLVDEGSFGGDISILLANVLYFKGQWQKAFSEDGTKTSCFYLSNGECQMTPMMDVVENFKYEEVKSLNAKFIELPYSGGEYTMVIVLPINKNGIQQLSRDIIRASINRIADNMNETEVFITLPRFKIEYNTDLVSYLPKVQVRSILTPNAKLNGIVADVSMRVSNALHKTYIEVNEQGTVAAAATGAVVIPLMGTTKPRFKADHPFLFFIRHIATGTILFEGRLSVPERSYVQQNHQGNQQTNFRPAQADRQQPTRRPFTSTAHNNFNPNYQAQPQPQPQPQSQSQPQPQPQSQSQPQNQNQNGYSTPQQNLNTQESIYYETQQASFPNSPSTSYQGQPQTFQNPTPILMQFPLTPMTSRGVGEKIKNQVLRGATFITRLQGQQVQSDDAYANDLRNSDSSKSTYPIVYPETNSGP